MSKIIDELQLSYLYELRCADDDLSLEIEKFARENNVPILNKLAADLLETLISIKQPKRALEIGTAIAYSTIKIARQLPAGALIDTIEKSADNIKLADGYIKRSGVAEKINLIEGDALDIMPESDTYYDFIFLDADKEDYKELFEQSMRLLTSGGVIFVDNLLWHGYAAEEDDSDAPDNVKGATDHIKKFNEIFTNCKYMKATILTVGDGIGLGVKK